MAVAVVAGAVGYSFTLSPTLAQDAGEDLKLLRQELAKQRAYIEQLEKRVESQEAKNEARAKAQAEAIAKLPAIEAGYDDGFYIRSKDKPFSLVANALGQFRYTYSNATGGHSNQTFDVALARLALSGKMFDPNLSYFMQMQGSTFGDNNNVTMLDWWMSYNFAPELSTQAGRFVLPYSRQFYTPPAYLMFADLSQADFAFNLPRSIGGHISGKLGPLSYSAAMLNSIRALDAPGQENFGTNMAASGTAGVRHSCALWLLRDLSQAGQRPATIGWGGGWPTIRSMELLRSRTSGAKDSTTNVTLDLGYRWDRSKFSVCRLLPQR